MRGYPTIGPMNPIGPAGRRIGLAELPPGVGTGRTFTLMEHLGSGEMSREVNWMQEFASVVRAYGWNPPPFHEPLNAGGSQTVNANTNFMILFTKSVPQGYIGCWAYWSQSLATVDEANIQWTLRIQGRSIRDFERIIGLFSSLANPEWVMQPIPPGGNIAVLGSNISGANIPNVGARARGWQWPIGTYRT